MISSAFNEDNVVMNPPEGKTCDEVSALSVGFATWVDGTPVTISCWKPTEEEWVEMRKTGRVWLAIWGHGMPPVAVLGYNPYEAGHAK